MHVEKFNPILPEVNDGFAIEQTTNTYPQIAEIVRHYMQVFTGTMKRKFNYLVFIDLFAGSGLKQLEGGQIEGGSAAKALANDQFSKYIFCSENQAQNHALKVRINTHCRSKNVAFFQGNPDNIIDKLAYYVPESNSRNKVAALCLVDLNAMELTFDSVKLLASLGVHLLIILRLDLEEGFRAIFDNQREVLNAFIGEPWGESSEELQSNEEFLRNLAKRYHQNISGLGYMAKGSFQKLNGDEKANDVFVGYYSHTKGAGNELESQENKSLQVSLFDR